jgi:GntR family transcriptional regulator
VCRLEEETVKIDPGSHVPIYLQIAEGIRSGIASAVYRPGEALPSQRTLAVRLQVNPNTIQRAYDELVREGLVYPQRGRGLFVAEKSPDSAQSHAEQLLQKSMAQAIGTARAAGMDDRSIRRQFQLALQHPAATGGNDHG